MRIRSESTKVNQQRSTNKSLHLVCNIVILYLLTQK